MITIIKITDCFIEITGMSILFLQ